MGNNISSDLYSQLSNEYKSKVNSLTEKELEEHMRTYYERIVSPISAQVVQPIKAQKIESDTTGKFVRLQSGFRNIISKDHPVFQPEYGRYHLYVSLACPWAHRCFIVLSLKQLTNCINVTVVHPTWQRTKPNDVDDKHCGWVLTPPHTALSSNAGYGSFAFDNTTADPNGIATAIRDLYEASNDEVRKYTVPVLWDKKTNQIVNNESSEIIRMLNTEFNEYASGTYADVTLYPEALRSQIDEVNDWVYPNINDGVYRCGFAKSQAAYDEAVKNLFEHLDKVEDILSRQRYMVDNTLTEADIRLFVTLLRFDEVYVVYFKTNVRSISSYPNISNYCREIYQLPGIKETVRMDHIKTHYFTSHPILNSFAIVPKGPNFIGLLEQPHDRNRFD